MIKQREQTRIGRSVVVFLALCLALSLPLTVSGQEKQAELRRPSVLLIVADDLGYGDLGCYGGKDIRTPRLDRLAEEGARLTDFYASAPVCSPTRASLITGRYPQRSGFEWVIRYIEKDRGLPVTETSVARLLKKQGYATGLFGKWHL